MDLVIFYVEKLMLYHITAWANAVLLLSTDSKDNIICIVGF